MDNVSNNTPLRRIYDILATTLNGYHAQRSHGKPDFNDIKDYAISSESELEDIIELLCARHGHGHIFHSDGRVILELKRLVFLKNLSRHAQAEIVRYPGISAGTYEFSDVRKAFKFLIAFRICELKFTSYEIYSFLVQEDNEKLTESFLHMSDRCHAAEQRIRQLEAQMRGMRELNLFDILKNTLEHVKFLVNEAKRRSKVDAVKGKIA